MENDYLIGIDLAKENSSDTTCLCMQFTNTCLDEMKELWQIGDEYLIPQFDKKRIGLTKDDKLIISSIYGDDKQEIVFMHMLVR